MYFPHGCQRNPASWGGFVQSLQAKHAIIYVKLTILLFALFHNHIKDGKYLQNRVSFEALEPMYTVDMDMKQAYSYVNVDSGILHLAVKQTV